MSYRKAAQIFCVSSLLNPVVSYDKARVQTPGVFSVNDKNAIVLLFIVNKHFGTDN